MSKSEIRQIRNVCFVAFMVSFSIESASQFSPDNISMSWGVEHFDPVKVEVEETNEPYNQSVRFIARNSTFRAVSASWPVAIEYTTVITAPIATQTA